MSEKSLSDALGIDQGAEEALARADVRTPRELSEADPEALAMASGVPLDRIKEWQQRARRAGAPRRRNPVVTGWMVAIVGLLIAVGIGWMLVTIGTTKMETAEKIRRAADSKLELEMSFGASRAMDDLRPVRLAVHNRNWGEATAALAPVAAGVAFIARVAPEGQQDSVVRAEEGLGELRRAIEDQSPEAMEHLTDLEVGLARLAGEESR